MTRGMVRTQAMQKLETYRKLAADLQRQNQAEKGLGSTSATDGALRALQEVRGGSHHCAARSVCWKAEVAAAG